MALQRGAFGSEEIDTRGAAAGAASGPGVRMEWSKGGNPIFYSGDTEVTGQGVPVEALTNYSDLYPGHNQSFESPEYSSILGPDGRLPDDLMVDNQYNNEYMNQLQDYATRQGPSPWLTAQQGLISSQGATARDDLEAQRLGGLQEAQEQLAMRGGLRSGAAERLAGLGMEAKMGESQDLSRALEQQMLEAQLAEEASKVGMMGQLPGMEAQRAQLSGGVQQQNIANLFGERERAHKFDLGKYQADRAREGAAAVASATESSNESGGGFFDIF